MASCHLWLLTALAVLLAPTGVFPRPRTHESVTPDQFPKTHQSSERYPNTQEVASRDSSPQELAGSSRSDRSPKTHESTDLFPRTHESAERFPKIQGSASRDSFPQEFAASSRSDRSPKTHGSTDLFPRTHESAERIPKIQGSASRDSSPQEFAASLRSDRSPKTHGSTDRFPGTQDPSPRTQALADDDIDISKVRSSGPKFSLDSIAADSQRTSRYLLGSRTMERMLVDFLDTLPEDDLRAMEELVPGSSSSSEEVEGEDLDGDLNQGDLIQGDMPASAETNGTQLLNSTDSDGNYTDQLQKANRERTKEMRLNSIKTQILSYLGLLGGQPNISSNQNNGTSSQQAEIIRQMYDKMKRLPQWPPSDVYTEKVQSFYPSCELPRNTDEELWSNGESMHLLFDLNFPTSLQGNVVNIIAAKLRLHKVSQANMTVAVSETCPPPAFEGGESTPPIKAFNPTLPLPPSPITVDDKKIRVSIYWYTRSLKKHRVKRKLLDSQMVSVYGDAWTEWNVRQAVKAWKESNKNFGLAIEVEDEDGNLLPAHKYFSPMNCSKEASTSRPIPGFLVDAARLFSLEHNQSETSNGGSSSAYHFNTHMFPMIDLCTVELPETEIAEAVLYHNAKFALERQLLTVVRNNSLTPADVMDDSRHRIRHQNHHRIVVMNSTAVEAMADAASSISSSSSSSPASASLIASSPLRHTEVVRRDNGDSVEEMTFTSSADDLDGDQLRKHIIVQKVIKRNRQPASAD